VIHIKIYGLGLGFLYASIRSKGGAVEKEEEEEVFVDLPIKSDRR